MYAWLLIDSLSGLEPQSEACDISASLVDAIAQTNRRSHLKLTQLVEITSLCQAGRESQQSWKYHNADRARFSVEREHVKNEWRH